jgi:hypothetical protein
MTREKAEKGVEGNATSIRRLMATRPECEHFEGTAGMDNDDEEPKFCDGAEGFG